MKIFGSGRDLPVPRRNQPRVDPKTKRALLRKMAQLEKRIAMLKKREALLARKEAKATWKVGQLGVEIKQIAEAMKLAEKKKKPRG